MAVEHKRTVGDLLEKSNKADMMHRSVSIIQIIIELQNNHEAPRQ